MRGGEGSEEEMGGVTLLNIPAFLAPRVEYGLD